MSWWSGNSIIIEIIMERNKALDICKGLGILLVIVGHMQTPFGRTIYGFHMGLFFFLSGYCFSNKYLGSFWTFLKKRTWRLMVPYLIFPAVAYLTVPHIDEVWYRLWTSNQLWDSYPYHILGTFWFLKSLWIASIISWVVIWFIKRFLPQMPYATPIVMLVVCYAVMGLTGIKTIHYLYYAVFYVAGYCVKAMDVPLLNPLPIKTTAVAIWGGGIFNT